MRLPKLCHHKPSGRAYYRDADRRCVYVGKWGSLEAQEEFNKVLLAAVKQSHDPAPKRQPKGITVRDLGVVYLDHCDGMRYSPGEMDGVRAMVKRFTDEAGDYTVNGVGPSVFKMVRDRMIAAGNTRSYINKQAGRFIRMLAYGVEIEKVNATIPAALREVAKLAPGRSGAKEGRKVRPAPDEDVLAALEVMPDDLAVMVQIQLLCGCRPGELWILRPMDVERGKSAIVSDLQNDDRDRDRGTWQYRPSTHKGSWQGRERVISLGPIAQGLLAPYLLRPAESLCFTTHTGRQWDRFEYRERIHDACKLAGVPPWNPYQLRHSRATEIRKRFGLEHVQGVLGHASRAMAENYGAMDQQSVADEVARRIG